MLGACQQMTYRRMLPGPWGGGHEDFSDHAACSPLASGVRAKRLRRHRENPESASRCGSAPSRRGRWRGIGEPTVAQTAGHADFSCINN
jgi:hypothetical protein